jgi:hypothetical protein
MCPDDTATAGSWAGAAYGWSTEIRICYGIGGTNSISMIFSYPNQNAIFLVQLTFQKGARYRAGWQ